MIYNPKIEFMWPHNSRGCILHLPLSPISTFTIFLQLNHEIEHKMDDWDLFRGIDIEDISALIALRVVDKVQESKEQSGSFEPILSGADYLRDLLNCSNHKRIYLVLRMQKTTFEKLCLWFREGGYLKDSRVVGVEQQVTL